MSISQSEDSQVTEIMSNSQSQCSQVTVNSSWFTPAIESRRREPFPDEIFADLNNKMIIFVFVKNELKNIE
ncbi:MAG: hypothetical protein DWP97_11620 [Calditrichaeota bacterium]|nr:MAG: hypothetical protein DWP97_11620 [Calditrichota bacterium]